MLASEVNLHGVVCLWSVSVFLKLAMILVSKSGPFLLTNRMWPTRSPAVLAHQSFSIEDAIDCKLRMLLLAHGGFSPFLVNHHFPFFYTKTASLRSILLTAHWIPCTVFLPYPAYFYSFGHFILGIFAKLVLAA